MKRLEENVTLLPIMKSLFQPKCARCNTNYADYVIRRLARGSTKSPLPICEKCAVKEGLACKTEHLVQIPMRVSDLQEHRYFSVLCDGCKEAVHESRVVWLNGAVRLTLCEKCYRRLVGDEEEIDRKRGNG